MNEKLLSTTAGTLDENELKKMRNSIYGACGIAYARPTCMTDQDWMNIGEKRTISYLFDIHTDVCPVNDLASYIINSVANLKGVFKGIFNLEENNMSKKSLEVKKVIYSGPCTIVIWADDSKTIVRCQDGDTYSKEVGLLMCLAKKVWGTNTSGSNFNDYISKVILEKEENE